MVEEDTYCIDILTQVSAMTRALQSLSLNLLDADGAPAGWWFTIVGVGLTAGWLYVAHRLRRERTVPAAMRLFHYSTIYLALVFVAAAVDAVLIV